MKSTIVVLMMLIGVIAGLSAVVSKKFNYEQAWQEITDMDSQQYPKTAKEKLDVIYQAAMRDQRMEDQIKALLYLMSIQTYLEEDSDQKVFDMLEADLRTAGFPASAILHSIRAEMYWSYYQSHYYLESQRSETKNLQLGNIATWDMKTLAKTALREYQLSLERSEELLAISIKDYPVLCPKGDGYGMRARPTLYDLLAHRALERFDENNGFSELFDAYKLSDIALLGSARDFAKLELSPVDSTSYKYQSLRLYQDLIRFHLKDDDTYPLAVVDLERLNYVQRFMTSTESKRQYELALMHGEESLRGEAASTIYTFNRAKLIQQSSKYTHPVTGESNTGKNNLIAYQLCQEAIKAFPDSYGGLCCKELLKHIIDPEVAFMMENIVLPDKPIKLTLSLRNVEAVQLRIYKLSPLSETDSNYGNYGAYWWQENLRLNKLLLTKPFYSTTFPGHNERDYNAHSFDAVLAGQPLGRYLVVISDDFAKVLDVQNLKLMEFTSSNLAVVAPRNSASTLKVLNRTTGKAVANATVTAYANDRSGRSSAGKPRLLWTLKTDKAGKVKLPNDQNQYSNTYTVSLGADCLNLGNYYYHDNAYAYRSEQHALLFTDRSIYRPGQIIYCKGILYESDEQHYHELLTNAKVTLTFRDTNYQVISTQQLITNDFGAINCSFTAPQKALNGRMTIEANNDKHSFGTAVISVEEYKRPKFEVKIDKPVDTYKLGQAVTVKGKATAYAGFAIDGAKVSYTVSRRPKFAYWCWWRYSPMPQSGYTLTTGNSTTDAKGEFSITFTAEGDDSYAHYEGLYFDFEVTATVTDLNGETQTGKSNLSIGAQDLILDPVIDDYVPLIPQPLAINIKSTNLSGEKIAVQGKITISRLQTPDHIQKKRSQIYNEYDSRQSATTDRNYLSREEFLKAFPTETYGKEDQVDTWKVARQVYQGDFDTASGDKHSIAEFGKWESGMYKLEAASTYRGQTVTVTRYFTVYAAKAKTLPYNTPDLFIPIQTDCQPGETAQVLIGSSYRDVDVLMQVERQHKIVSSETVVLNNEQYLFSTTVLESDRGGFFVHISYWRDNCFYTHSQEIAVAWKNKQLDFEYLTFRDKLLPGQPEEWRLKLKDYTGGAVTAELLASMYDASLDALQAHKWEADVYHKVGMTCGWNAITATYTSNGNGFHNRYYPSYPNLTFSSLSDFGLNYAWGNRRSGRSMYMDDMVAMSPGPGGGGKGSAKMMTAPTMAAPTMGSGGGMSTGAHLENGASSGISRGAAGTALSPEPQQPDLSTVTARKNLQETAFFYPTLRTDEQGEVSVSFTVPEALTRWKFQALALTRDLQIGLSEKTTVTQKPLMVTPNLPRFFREGDKITISAKVSALDDATQSGQCQLFLYDALSNVAVESLFRLTTAQKPFSVQPGASTVVEWTLEIPFGISAVSCKIVAQAGKFSDGEQITLPILTNRMLVTESLPLPIRGKSSKSFVFDKLLKSQDSATLRNHRLTLEYTSNPAWYAVQALPYLMEYPYDCNEQIFTRYYANSLATHIANANPRLQRVFEAWKSNPDAAALLSNLEKNPELKAVILQETPWVMDAKNETQSKQRIGLLFDLNNMRDQQAASLARLMKNQSHSGAWSWFPGMQDSWWVTQYILEGLGHLQHLGVEAEQDRINSVMIERAIRYIDTQILEDYTRIQKQKQPDDDHLGYIEMHYLYARSYYLQIKPRAEVQVALDYFRKQASKYWGDKGMYGQALLALAEHRFGNSQLPTKIIKSFDEKAFKSEELGMWWKENTLGWNWYQAPIETQALLIEAYSELTKDTAAVDDMRIWLLKQKQTTNWKTTKATAEACYALLLSGTQWLDADQQAVIKVGGKLVEQDAKSIQQRVEQDADPAKAVTPEAGTGYFKTSWTGSDIKAEQANIQVTNPNPGPAWGAMYWQYFENLDKITPAQTPLKLKKQLFIERITAHGKVIEPISDKAVLKVGDKVIVRIEISTDRDMEYVHLKDMRSAGFEPINVLSRYKYQDRLGYYEATGDAATNFFIEYLAKGTYVFEYPLRVANKGDFSNGITSIQCMYAPEFTAHSAGIRVEVK